MKIVTLKEAKARVPRRYFTGEPCKPGHISERRTANRQCIACQHDEVRTPEFRQKNRAAIARFFNNPDNVERYREYYRLRMAEQRRDPSYLERQNARRRVVDKLPHNREKTRVRRRAYLNRRLKSDLAFRLTCEMRIRLVNTLKGRAKPASAVALLGCSIDDARKHIERQFREGMTWENWGRGWNGAREWHIDHIRPLSSFDMRDPDQVAQAFHFTNLQPLWSQENLEKSGRVQ